MLWSVKVTITEAQIIKLSVWVHSSFPRDKFKSANVILSACDYFNNHIENFVLKIFKSKCRIFVKATCLKSFSK